MAAPSKIDPATATLDRYGHLKDNTYTSLSGIDGIPTSTLYHCNNKRMSSQQKVINQQFLTPQEEKTLVFYKEK